MTNFYHINLYKINLLKERIKFSAVTLSRNTDLGTDIRGGPESGGKVSKPSMLTFQLFLVNIVERNVPCEYIYLPIVVVCH